MSIPDAILHSLVSHSRRLDIHVAAKPVDRHYIKHTVYEGKCLLHSVRSKTAVRLLNDHRIYGIWLCLLDMICGVSCQYADAL